MKSKLEDLPLLIIDTEGGEIPNEVSVVLASDKFILPVFSSPIRRRAEELPACAMHNAGIIEKAPSEETIFGLIEEYLKGRKLAHYGRWDREWLKDVIDVNVGSVDLMEMVAPYVSSFDMRRNNWPWLSLERVAAMANIAYPPPGPHNSFSDAWVTARLAQILLYAPKNKLELFVREDIAV